MSAFGPVHKLVVREVGEPYGRFSTEEFDDYEIEHPPACKQDGEAYDCGVWFNVEHIGARYSLHHAGTPVTEPGVYPVRAWAETYRGFDYTEYDGGICLVPPSENI